MEKTMCAVCKKNEAVPASIIEEDEYVWGVCAQCSAPVKEDQNIVPF